MGQRTPTETLFGIVAAFVEKRTWTQADLAKRLETRTETIRKQLNELVSAGFKLEREEDHPHVYWSVPKDWFPGALLFKTDEVSDLLRLLSRAPRGTLRTRVLGLVTARLANLGRAEPHVDPGAVRPADVPDDEERWLAVAEDAVAKRVPMKMRYFTASRRSDSWRHVSVHRVDLGPRTHFIATCHQSGGLKTFRLSNVSDAKLDPGEAFRPTTAEDLRRLDDETFGGYREAGPAVRCAFVVRDPDAAWVTRNLPDPRIEHAPVAGGAGGTRFSVTTSGVQMLARFVVGLGEAAHVETPELAAAVAKIAHGALGGARPKAPTTTKNKRAR